MATIQQDPNQPTLDAIDSMFNGLRLVSPFNEIGNILSPEVPQEMDPGNGQIQPVGFIGESALDGIEIFADDIRPVAVVAALPTLPDTDYPEGSFAFLTTDGKLYRNVADAWTKSVDGADIIADSITAGSIAAGAIGATELASQIILGGLIVAGDPDGARIELDNDGLRTFDSSENILLNAPTDDSPLYVNAQIEALELVVTGDAVFQGTGNAFAIGSATELQAQQAAPSQAPTIFKAHDTTVPQIVPDADVDLSDSAWQRTGLDYSAAGGVGGATKVFYTSSIDNLGVFFLVEMLTADMTVNRFAEIDSSDFFFAIVQNVHGVARHGDYIYVLMKVHFDLSDQYWVARYAASDMSFDDVYTSISFPNASPRTPVIASDGTNIYIADKASGTGTIKWNLYNATMVKQGSTIDTSFNSDTDDHLRDMAVGSFDFGATRIALFCEKDDEIELFNSSGTRQANEVFPGNGGTSTDEGGLTYGDADGTGARFWSASGTQMGAVTRHTNWVWTTASSIYWVGYSWYDSSATTHETTVGPLASITLGRRQMLGISMATIPGSGGADEPDNHRVYIFPNATAPATTSLDLQATTANDNIYLTTYDSGGAAPPAANDFPSGTPAELASATAGWVLRGDGTADFDQIDFGGDTPVYQESTGMIAMGDAHGIRLRSNNDATLAGDDHPLTIGNDNGDNVAFDNNEIQARSNGSSSVLMLNKDGGEIQLGPAAVSIAENGSITAAGFSSTAAGVMNIGGSGPGYIVLTQRSLPAAADANTLRLFADINGGKMRLRVRWPSATSTLATEP